MISLLFVKASLLILAALGITFVLRFASAAVRSACWTILAALLLLLPVATRYAPRLSVDVPAAATSALVPAIQVVSTTGVGDRSATTIPLVLATVWLAGVIALLGGFVLGAVRVRGVLHRATPIADGSAIAVRSRVLVSNLRIRRRVRVMTSGEVHVPLTGGVVRPYIILPGSCDEWSSSRVQSVLVHEMAHVTRLDYATHIMFELARALYWPNPLVWRAMSRATIERERAADDCVLAGGATAAAYATDLLDFASSSTQMPGRRAALGFAASSLKTRIRAILRSGVHREDATPRQLTAIATAGIAGLLPVAGLTFTVREAVRDLVAPAKNAVVAPIERARPSQVIARRSDQYFVTRTVGNSRSDSLLFVLINAKEARVRLAAARSLRNNGADIPVVDVLVSALADTCHADRWLATRALRELRAKRALPNLVRQLVEDSHVAVRSMTASAIATAGVSEGAALLQTAIDGAEKAQVARVTRALDTLGETAAHAQLVEAVRRASH